MKRFTALAALFIGQLITQAAHAQHHDISTPQGLDEADATRLHSEFVRFYLHPVIDRPYSADEVTEHKRILADGNRIESVKRHAKMRDREGRQRYTIHAVAEREHTVIIDPVAHAAYLIRPERKDVLRVTNVMPRRSIIYARTAEQTWTKEVRTALGLKQIEGITAEGSLTEVTKRAGADGSSREMQESQEYWRNNEMQLQLYMRMSSPRTGERIQRLENLHTDEVPASAFALPADYVVRDVTPPKPAPKDSGSAAMVARGASPGF
jgi:hypothetical protein